MDMPTIGETSFTSTQMTPLVVVLEKKSNVVCAKLPLLGKVRCAETFKNVVDPYVLKKLLVAPLTNQILNLKTLI